MSWDRYQYLLLLAGCLVVTAPLELVFGARVYRQPRRLLRALAVPLVIFALWDVAAIARHDWSYNRRYVTGWDLPLRLPVEELLFFVVVPICGLLTYGAVSRILDGEFRIGRSVRRRGDRG